MCSVNIIGSHDYLTAQMLAALYFTSRTAFFFSDDTIVSAAFYTTDLIIKQYSLCTSLPEMFTGREHSLSEHYSASY